jgi:hypothetical protein
MKFVGLPVNRSVAINTNNGHNNQDFLADKEFHAEEGHTNFMRRTDPGVKIK